MSLTIEWVGLACFRLSLDGGPVIVADPYDPKIVADASKADVKLFQSPLQGDTVICSSFTDRAHGVHDRVDGKKEVINALDVATGRERGNDPWPVGDCGPGGRGAPSSRWTRGQRPLRNEVR